jgi:hypothetical protein
MLRTKQDEGRACVRSFCQSLPYLRFNRAFPVRILADTYRLYHRNLLIIIAHHFTLFTARIMFTEMHLHSCTIND